MPNHARSVHFPSHIVIPARDLVRQYRTRLGVVTITPAGFEELVRQCLDIYLNWRGREREFAELPDLNRIEVPELNSSAGEAAYMQVVDATSEFAALLQKRLTESGLFLNGEADKNLDYGFDRFVNDDILLFHLPY